MTSKQCTGKLLLPSYSLLETCDNMHLLVLAKLKPICTMNK